MPPSLVPRATVPTLQLPPTEEIKLGHQHAHHKEPAYHDDLDDCSDDLEDDEKHNLRLSTRLNPGRLSTRSTITDDTSQQGMLLVTRHTQTYIAITWLVVLVIYVCLMEYIVYAHKLPPESSEETDEVVTFGRQGTPWRIAVVQSFNVIRTVLAVAHVPIVTGTLASTLPSLTQRNVGRQPPKLSASQLFMLADKSWSGASGWINGIMVGNLPWAWWKLTLVTMATFIGFPLMTLGYMVDSQQFWQPEAYNGVALWGVNGTMKHNINYIQPKIHYWVHSKPQRNLAGADVTTILLEKNLAFYPPAVRNSKLGHFVSLAPESASGRDGLMVANTLGFLQRLNCRPLPQGQEPELIDFSEDAWRCKVDCEKDEYPDLCHAKISRGFTTNKHTSQVASCARGHEFNIDNGVSTQMEIAIKINPSYETGVKTAQGNVVFPFTDPQRKPYSFRAGDKVSGEHHYVEVIQCNLGFLPGQAIVDSVIRKFMHFSPFNLPGVPRQSYAEGLIVSEAQEVALWSELRNLLNLTATIPVTMLHEYFLTSNYAQPRPDFNSSLPYWFGVQKAGKPLGEIRPLREPLSQDQYLIDNMVRLNATIFSNAFVGMANSTLIRALPSFLRTQKQTSFIYLTDVRVRRGSLPIILAPLMLLGPICFVVYISLEQWNTPTWTEFLDAWAMFKLGREWRYEMVGEGAVSLRESWQAKVLPGYVGDSNVPGENGKWAEGGGVGGAGEKVVGHLKLGGRAPLRGGVYYT